MGDSVWWAVFGWIGSAVLIYSLMQTRITRLRIFNLTGCILAIAYNALIEVWPSVGLNAVLAVVNIVHLARIWRTRDAATTYEVIAVDPSDNYLRHLVTVKREDIEKYHNITVDQALQRADHGFLVVREDETVGITLLHREGTDVAHVDLDYVTPRWRDLTVSQFLYHRSDLLQREGFTRVITDPDADPVYTKFGFTPNPDGSFELRLAKLPAAH